MSLNTKMIPVTRLLPPSQAELHWKLFHTQLHKVSQLDSPVTFPYLTALGHARSTKLLVGALAFKKLILANLYYVSAKGNLYDTEIPLIPKEPEESSKKNTFYCVTSLEIHCSDSQCQALSCSSSDEETFV